MRTWEQNGHLLMCKKGKDRRKSTGRKEEARGNGERKVTNDEKSSFLRDDGKRFPTYHAAEILFSTE